MGAGVSLAALGVPAAAQAADFTVTKLADTNGSCDPGDCSLREAIAAADNDGGEDRILFQAGLSGSITLTAGALSIDEPLEILGPGAETLTVSGNDSSRIFDVSTDSDDPVTISGLALTAGSAAPGGAIRTQAAELTISESEIAGNSSPTTGGGLMALSGTITIVGSQITGNSASDTGGGVRASGSELTVRRSTISGNSASIRGGGIYSDNGGDLTIERSTVSGHTGSNAGAGVAVSGGTLMIDTSTIAGNGANFAAGVNAFQAELAIESSTISGNTAAINGGGVTSSYPSVNPLVSNTIVAGNEAPDSPNLRSSPVGTPFDVHFSLLGPVSGTSLNVLSPSILGADPQLNDLADNGGPTETMAPELTSPAVDNGFATEGTDQRGLPRPVLYPGIVPLEPAEGNGSDIGAVELQLPPPPPPPPPSASNQFSFAGLKLNRRRGTATLFVRVPGPGRLVLRGPGVRRVVRTPPAARRVGLPIRARARALKRLRRGGRARVAARITYAPTGGSPRTRARSVRLVRNLKRRR